VIHEIILCVHEIILCVWGVVLPTVTFSEAYIGKSFVLKGSLLGFFSLLPSLEPEFELVIESSVFDIPAPPLPQL
jgi:hypothetical protein